MSVILISLLIMIPIIVLGLGAQLYNKKLTNFSWKPTDEFQIEFILEKYFLKEKFKLGTLYCIICNETLSHNNLGPLIENDANNQIDILCNKSVCLLKYFDNHEDELS